MSTVFEELKRRGLIAQMTHEEQIKELLDEGQTTFYIGFDATADSLHVGHFLQLMIMAHMQRAGHRPIAILGTGTTMIGDPTGKTDMRKMLTKEEIDHNAECFRKQMSKFVDFSDGKAMILRNGDWLLNLNYMEFIRDIGVHFSVNKMLTAECFQSRLEKGLSFLEFNYMLMQSYDFLKLYRDYGCRLELGGNDQWSNIIGGVELIRRVEHEEAYGMTFTLLTTKEGKKMGKTEGGAVWLDPEKTSPYDFYQYWRNVSDDDVINCLKLITFVPMDEIDEMAKWEGQQLNVAKQRLAFEITKMVHSEEEAIKAQEAALALFSNNAHSDDMPTAELTSDDLIDGVINIMDLLVKVQLVASKGEARRLITQGGISVDDQKVTDIAQNVSVSDFEKGHIIVKKGKKVFHKVVLA